MASAPNAELPQIEYRPLSEAPRGAFSCGVKEIDRWYKKCWRKHTEFQSRVTTAHFVGSDEIIGFYSLGTKLEDLRLLTPDDRQRWKRFQVEGARFMAVHFEFLAVAQHHQKKGIGSILTGQVIRDFARVSDLCGIDIMTGCALTPQLLPFYIELGFEKYGYGTQRPSIYFSGITAIEVVKAMDVTPQPGQAS